MKHPFCIPVILLFAAAVFAAENTETHGTPHEKTLGLDANSAGPAELLKRLEDNYLSQEQLSAVAARVLRLQADSKTSWDPRWGEFIENAHAAGKLPGDLWHKYMLGAVQLQVYVAVETKRSDGLSIRYDSPRSRGGPRWSSADIYYSREDDISDVKLPVPDWTTNRGPLMGGFGGGMGWKQDLTDGQLAGLRPGRQSYHYRYRLELFSSPPQDGKPAKPLAERAIEGTIPWTLLRDDQPFSLPPMKADESLRPAVEMSLRAWAVRDESYVQVTIHGEYPPVGMAFNAALRGGGRTFELGQLAFTTQRAAWDFDIDLPPGVDTFEVVLTPSPAVAAKLRRRKPYDLAGLDSIWNGTVVVKPGVHSGGISWMLAVLPPSPQDAREDETERLEGDDPVIREFKRGGNLATACRQLEEIVRQNPANATARFNLGCLEIASGNYRYALDCFAQVRQAEPSSALAYKAQRQLRRIGGYFRNDYGSGGLREDAPTAMCGLGIMYERGWGPKQDRLMAKWYYRNAANRGNAEAMCRLAALYDQDLANSHGKPKAQDWYRGQVLELYRKSAGLGNEEAKKWVATHEAKYADKALPLAPGSNAAQEPNRIRSERDESKPPPAAAGQAPGEYDHWVEKYAKNSLPQSSGSRDGPTLTVTVYDEVEKAGGQVQPKIAMGSSGYCCRVSGSGDVSHANFSDFGSKGSWGYKIPPAEFKRLNDLLARLPDNKSRLPPPGRRMIVTAAVGGRTIVKVYDRAHLPDDVLEVLRISECLKGAWVPEFRPQSEIGAGGHGSGGYTGLSADRSKIVFCQDGPEQLFEPVTREYLGTNRAGSWSPTAFSPDGSRAAVTGNGFCALVEAKKWEIIKRFDAPSIGNKQQVLSDPRFTSDGKYLVVQCGALSLRIFDTRTGDRVMRLPDVPEDSVQYIPAPGRRAVVRSKSGVLSLWDLDRHAPLAEMDKGCFVFQLAFAPDKSQVAIVTTDKWISSSYSRGNPRLRVWKLANGELVHELRPFELPGAEAITCPLWLPDGRYLLAANWGGSMFSPVGVSVWNLKTGRHCGQFTGCVGKVNGVVLLADNSELVVGCDWGTIGLWDFPTVMKRIRDFEDSF